MRGGLCLGSWNSAVKTTKPLMVTWVVVTDCDLLFVAVGFSIWQYLWRKIFFHENLWDAAQCFGLASSVLHLMIFEKKNISSWKPLGSSLVLFRFGSICSPICVETCSTVFQFCTDVLGMVSNWSFYLCIWASLIAQLVKNPAVMQETLIGFLGQEDPLEKG